MRVLIFHGYLLRGTGSNVYNLSLAAALRELGHEVVLLCQERAPLELDPVDAAGDWDAGELRIHARREPVRCTVLRPDLGGLLPVYVADRYEGVRARPFPELTDSEVERYLEANVRAVRETVARTRPDVALANHLVMGPAVLARALAGSGVPYAVKIHGSALEYVVRPHPRFLPWAREGIAAAAGVLVGSRHTAERLWETLDDPALPLRTRLGPPGVDVARFHPRSPAATAADLAALAATFGAAAPAPAEALVSGSGHVELPVSAFARDEGEAAAALRSLDLAGDRHVAFVGKLIPAKGIDLLLAAWPLVVAEQPHARLVVVGFGEWRAGAERLVALLAAGDLDAALALAEHQALRHLSAFLTELRNGPPRERTRYLAAAARLPERILFAGRLEHDELAPLLSACEAMVVPSTFPEAFGMVAAEAAACGVLPICAAHSGLAEVTDALSWDVAEPARAWLSFPVDDGAVRTIAERVNAWLAAPVPLRAETRAALARTAAERWSWHGVARDVIAAARGELDTLPRP